MGSRVLWRGGVIGQERTKIRYYGINLEYVLCIKKRTGLSLPARPAVGGYDGVVGVYCGVVGMCGQQKGGPLMKRPSWKASMIYSFSCLGGRKRLGGSFEYIFKQRFIRMSFKSLGCFLPLLYASSLWLNLRMRTSLGTPFSPPQAQNLSQREIGTSSWSLSKPRFSERIFWRSWGVIVSAASRKGSFWNPQLEWRGVGHVYP